MALEYLNIKRKPDGLQGVTAGRFPFSFELSCLDMICFKELIDGYWYGDFYVKRIITVLEIDAHFEYRIRDIFEVYDDLLGESLFRLQDFLCYLRLHPNLQI
jgi:hypothetical protein